MLKAAELHASSSRLVIVASEMHFVTHFDEAMIRSGIVAKLNDKEYCTPEVMSARYPASKRTCFHSRQFYMCLLTFPLVLNVLFTRAFAHYLSDVHSSSLITNTVNPGLCATDLSRNASLATWLRIKTMLLIMGRTAEQGARQLVWAALGPDGKEGPHVKPTMQGAYVSIAEIRQPSDFVTSREGWDAQESLWVSRTACYRMRVRSSWLFPAKRETVDILSNVSPSVRDIVKRYFKN
jgi:retinol dehydrogenase 12